MANPQNSCASPSHQDTLRIFKFGGSCFNDENSFNQSLKIIEHFKKDRLIIVCSALFGITNKLIEYGRSVFDPGLIKNASDVILTEIEQKHILYINSVMKQESHLTNAMLDFIRSKIDQIKEFNINLKEHGMTPKNSDYLVSFGERISAYMYAEFLKSKGYKAEFIPTDKEFIITNEDFGNALPILPICEENIRKKLIPLLNENKIIVVPGFYGSTVQNEVSTLGRGGSDFTATIIGYALSNDYNANVIFWKDVDGILSANPKYVPKARLLKMLSYKEAKELAYFGTNILHPLCLKTAEQRNVIAEIRNYNNPFNDSYTQITRECIIPARSNEIIKGITSLDKIAMVTIESDAMISLPGSAAKIFGIMGQFNININFISQCSSENNITFGTTPENGAKAKKVLVQNEFFGKHWMNVKVDDECSLLSLVGAGMAHKPGVAGLLFTTLGNAGINIRAIAQGSSELNITLVIAQQDLKRAINVIYDTFIEGNLPQQILRW